VTAQIVTGDGARAVVRLPPRDRGTLIEVVGPVPGAVYAVEGDEIVVGRSPTAGVSVDEQSLSRRHARVFRAAGGFHVEDLDSTNGTFVNGERVSAPRALRDGDRIQIGLGIVLRFALHDAAEQETAQQLYESAVRDPLTGLFNRRYLADRLTAEHSFALRHATDLTVMLADVDHFKRVNDQHGHAAGDAVLRAIGQRLARALRSEDLVARYGGEEFCIVGRALDAQNAALVAERCRSTIASLAIDCEGGPLSITVSIGVATLSPTQAYRDPAALLDAADRALYAAKESGRNRVCTA
jgi:diguanylate cyclase (GGDEF)-like protein